MNFLLKNKLLSYLPIAICIIFFIAYSTLSIVKHQHFLSGYDLAVTDQAIWKYSKFVSPITTIHAYYDTPVYYDHFEPILAVISPVFWLTDSTEVLLLLQVAGVVISAYFIYLLARYKKLNLFLSISLLIVYLVFYGIQNALWSDFHTLILAIPFLSAFIYFLETKNLRASSVAFVLAIVCKEDIAMFTFLISVIHYIVTKQKTALWFALSSVLYLASVFGIFFPHFTDGYRFQNSDGLLSSINVNNFYNTSDKREAIFYSLASYGFIPLLAPIYLLLFVADLGHYFVLGSDYVSSAQGLFLHYRSTLALFLSWPTIAAIVRFKKLNKPLIGGYLIVCAIIVQYVLHLPLSYLAKQWFWQKPSSVSTIEKAIERIPKDSSVATQVNISAHMSHRDKTYLLWPIDKNGKKWFRIGDRVEYILIDTSTDWDARHFLEDREQFIKAIKNLEEANLIKPVFQKNSTSLYKVSGKI